MLEKVEKPEHSTTVILQITVKSFKSPLTLSVSFAHSLAFCLPLSHTLSLTPSPSLSLSLMGTDWDYHMHAFEKSLRGMDRYIFLM